MADRIPQHFIDELLARTDIVALIDERVPLKKTGKNYSACCPFHNEKTPSFSVNPDKQFYYCFGCGMGGNALSFVMEYDRLEFVEAVEDLAHRQGLDVPREDTHDPAAPKKDYSDAYQLMERVSRYYQQQLREHKDAARAVDYLKNRGLSGEVAKTFEIGYAPGEWRNLLPALGNGESARRLLIQTGMMIEKGDNAYDRFRDRIMFPIRDRRGRVIGFGGRVIDQGEPKYLNSPETDIFHKGIELYGLYQVRQQRQTNQILVVEGYMDVVALAQFGLGNAVATLGTASSDSHFQQMFRICPQVVLCFDGDRAGREAALRALEHGVPQIRDRREIRVLLLPQGEDPDTLVRAEGKEGLQQRIDHAPGAFEFLLQHLKQQVDLERFEGPANLVNLAKPWLEKIADPILQEQWLQSVADTANLSVARLEQLLGITPTKSAAAAGPVGLKKKQVRPTTTLTPALTPMRQAVRLILQQPRLAAQLPEQPWLSQAQEESWQFLSDLMQCARGNPQITTGSLVEQWRDTPMYKGLTQLAMMPFEAEGNEQQVLSDTLAKLQLQQMSERLEHLKAKSQQQDLSAAEKEELKTLLLEHSRSASGRKG